MSYDRIHALLSGASEAVLSEDGRIKRRLHNYETIVSNNSEDPYFMPVGAVNDNYGNLDFQNIEVMNADTQEHKVTVLRYARYAIIGLVSLGFLWSLYSLISPTAKTISENNVSRAVSDTDADTNTREMQLERIANLVIRDGEWTNVRVELFLRQWNKTDYDAQEAFKKKAWYQHFTYRLQHQLKQEYSIGAIDRKLDSAVDTPIVKLASALGVSVAVTHYAMDNSKSPDDAIYQQLANEVSTELARVEESKLETEKSRAANTQADPVLTAQLKQELAGKTPRLISEPRAISDIAKPAQQPVSTSAQLTSVQSNPAQLTSVNVKQTVAPSINEQDVAQVLQKYSAAYERGDLQELSSLFGVSDAAEGKKIIAQLKANYENVFANSSKRSVNLKALDWQFEGNRAIVNTAYNAEMELNNNKGTQTVTANAKLELNKTQQQLHIASFELLNRKVNVITPEITLASTTPALTNKPDRPTAAELQDIVTRLVSSYESGDLETFTSLFARDAKTNDRTDLKGIRQDYQQLFKNSSDRQMFIQDMNWSYGDNHAKGSGDLEAIVLSASGNPVYSMTGKIQIVAQRIDGKVRITRLYHLERTK